MSEHSNTETHESEDVEKYLHSLMLRWNADRTSQRRLATFEGMLSLCVIVLSGTGCGFAYPYLVHQFTPWALLSFLFCGLFFLVGVGCFLRYREHPSERAMLIAVMHRFDDVRVIPYALEAHRLFEGRDEANTIYLTRALLQLKPENAPALKPHLDQIVALVTEKKVGHGEKERLQNRLRLSALAALKNVGDTSVLFPIEKVANRPAQTEYEQKIVRFAQDCLQTLRKRAEQTAVSQVLLRPAHSFDEQSELLRAATVVTDQNPDELLRVSDA